MSTGLTLIKGAMGTTTYASSWSVPATELAQDAKVFMDASFTLGNAVYSGNKATLTFSDNVQASFPVAASAGTAPNCYMTGAHLVSAGSYTACSATGASTVEVSNLKASPGNTQFIFRVLATLNTTTGQTCRIVTAKTEYH